MKVISKMSEREEVKIEHDIIDLDDLTCHPHNPRLIRKKKFSDLQKSLKEDMWMMSVNQIIIDESNVILSGNQRVRALRKMGITNAPVIRLIGASEEQKKRLLYKINDHNGENDPDMVAHDLVGSIWTTETQLHRIGENEFNSHGAKYPDRAGIFRGETR